MLRQQIGFTLIELMIAISIIAILMAIGIPSYQSQIRKGQRAEGQRVLVEISSRQEQYMMNRQVYTTVLGPAGLNYTVDNEVADNYTFDIQLTVGPPDGFVVTAKAIGSQVKDGDLSLSSNGVKTPASKW